MVSSKPNMENFLREWRQNALNKAQHDAAIFVGDKLLAMTSMPEPGDLAHPLLSCAEPAY